MWRDQPDALAGRHLHYAVDRINELIGTVRMFGNTESAGIFIRERGNRDAPFGVVFRDQTVSQWRYIMA